MTYIKNINIQGNVDDNNSTDVLLLAGETFTGQSVEILDFGIIFVSLFSDVKSTEDGLEIQQSSDGVNWDHIDEYTYANTYAKNYSINPHSKYMRVVYTNGLVDQTEFRLQTVLKGNSLASSHRLSDDITVDDDAPLTLSVIKVETTDEHTYRNVSVQNPLPTDGDSVYIKDVDFDNSNLNSGWTGDIQNLFLSPFSESVINVTGDNPKIITVSFKRTINAIQIGIGENNGGDFSNVEIVLKGSGGQLRSIYNNSGDTTKITSLNAEFEQEIFNSVEFRFYTDDPVSISNLIIYKTRNNSTQIQGKKPNGDFIAFGATQQGSFPVSLKEYQGDAFGRLRVSEPYTIFDNSLTSDTSNELFWSMLTGGTGSGSYNRLTSSFTLSTALEGDFCIRQTKQRFKYQPGKSHEILLTGLFSTETNQLKRVGYLDYDNIDSTGVTFNPENGVCFENNSGELSFCIYNNGIKTESVTQANWNLDKCDGLGGSEFILDINSTNILFMDMEWLGVGAVRIGWVRGKGEIVAAHQFKHASKSFTDVYMRTANLPISYGILSGGGAGSMKQICGTVISEGGFNPKGVTTSVRNTTGVNINGTEILCGIRLKENSFEFTIDPTTISVISSTNANALWSVQINPTYTGAVTWNDLPNSEVEYAVNNDNTVTADGIIVLSGSFANNNDGSTEDILSSLHIAKDLYGNRDELWLVLTSLASDTFYGTLNFRELL